MGDTSDGGFHFHYSPSPTCKRFHLCDDRVRCILGPVGSGKSVACIVEGAMIRAMKQEPDVNGVRKTRGVMVRNTYNELVTTTLKTFKEWFGTSICKYRSDKPLSATVRFAVGDGTKVECEVIFLACDKAEDAEKMRSLEITWGYINEASEINTYAVCDILSERIGRYPKQWRNKRGEMVGGATWSGIFMDTNAPDDEHWIYRKFEIEKPKGFTMFHQPPAVLLAEGSTPDAPVWELNVGQRDGIPAAENLEHLGRVGHQGEYYMNQIPGKDYERIRVMLMGEYGTIAYGRPVYPSYKDRIHYMPNYKDPKTGGERDVQVLRGLPLVLGFDFGIQYAACIFAQLSPINQLRVVEEMVVKDLSTREFAAHVIAKLRNDYTGMTYSAWCDPAGRARAQTDGMTNLLILNECGIPTRPCETNSPKQRIESVMYFLERFAEGEPGLVVGSKCPMIRKGFMGRYYYKPVSTASREQIYAAEPVKNEFSHPHDALQYIATSLKNTPEAYEAATRAFGSSFDSREDSWRVPPVGIDGSMLL